jgi:hypothetical protein
MIRGFTVKALITPKVLGGETSFETGKGERALDHSMWAIAKLTSRARQAAGVGSGPLPRPSRRASLWATAARTPLGSDRVRQLTKVYS